MSTVYAITGANRGLGLEFARQLLASPTNTVIGAVRSLSGSLSDLEALLPGANGRLHILECDTANSTSITTFGEAVSALLGREGQLHYLFNNAGINSHPEQTSLNLTQEVLREHMDVNVFGPARTVQVLLPHLQPGSVVMNMTSGLGSISKSIKVQRCASYSVSKAAVNMLTVHQAGDLKGRGVRVICMDPGWVKTRMGGDDAPLESEETIRAMLEVVRGLGEGDTAKYYTYTGEEVPW